MSDEKAQSLVFEQLFQLPPGAADDPFTFINECLLFLNRWCAAYPGPIAHGAPAYACFVGCERVNADIVGLTNCEERRHFRDDTPSDLLGKIYLCAYPMARVFSHGSKSSSLEDCERVLASAGLSNRPVVFYNAADRRILWRMDAQSEMRQLILRAPTETKMTSAQFDEILVDFHRNYTETPQGFTKPWKSGKRLLTKHDLENEIRDDLYLFLNHLAREPMGVLREFYNSAGRSDLLVQFKDEKLFYYVELKVLRSWSSSGNNRVQEDPQKQEEWAKKGVAQVYSYRLLQKLPGAGYACCFDAREQNLDLPDVAKFAQEKEVRFRRYFMYSSSDAHKASLMN